jgi:hypothetical protein
VLVLPGHKTIRWSSLRKIMAFFDAGGTVIATGALPAKSAEFGHDEDVTRTIAALFGTQTPVARNANGGAAICLKTLNAATLREALDLARGVYDVEVEGKDVLRYIHKIKDGIHIYLFANLSGKPVDAHARLRGRMDLEIWDPHTGRVTPAEFSRETKAGGDVTRVRLTLSPTKSIFILGQAAPSEDASQSQRSRS